MTKKVKPSTTMLLPGALMFGEDGEPRPTATVEDFPPGTRIVVTRYFVAANAIMDNGDHALAPLTPYLYTYAAAFAAYEDLRETYPSCAILWANTIVDPTDAGQMAELAQMRAKWDDESATAGIQ